MRWVIILIFGFIGCSTQSAYEHGIEQMRKEEDDFLRNQLLHPSSGMNTSSGMGEKFVRRDYFGINHELNIKAKFIRFECQDTIRLLASNKDIKRYIRVGQASFMYKDNSFSLTLTNPVGFNNRLILLFSDGTNSKETCSYGRYLEVDLLSDSTVQLDFNLAYHPICYLFDRMEENFACPEIPDENNILLRIEAGERNPIFRE